MAYGKMYSYTLKFDADVSNVRTQVQSVLNQLSDISKKDVGIGYNANLREAVQAAQQLGKYLYDAFNVDTQKLDLTKFTRSIQKSGMSLDDFRLKLKSIGPEGEKAFLDFAMAISRAEVPALRLNKLLDGLWVTMKNTMRWQLTSSMLHGFIGTVQTAWRYTQDLNESLTSIRVVTGMSTEEMAQFAQEANKAAQALNTTTVDYTDASLIYYQQGLDAEQVKERTRITIDAANAAGTSAEQMSEYLTAVWNSYQVATDQLERYVDKMAAVGANTATSLEEISTAMVNVASTANTVGVNMDQLTAIISTVASTTRQSATSIGTAFKTIFARIGDLKLGETLEDGLDLGTVSKQLNQIGINILDTTGDLRDMGEVVEEIGEKWQTWTAAQQTAVAQAIAGKRQYTQLIALFDNWNAYQNAFSISKSSEGTLAKQAETFAEGWEAARKRVIAAKEGIYDSLFNADTWIGLDKAFTKVFNRIENIIDAVGGLGGISNTVVLGMTTLYKDKLVNGLRDAQDALLSLSVEQRKLNERMRQDLIDSIDKISGGEATLDMAKDRAKLQLQYDNLRRNMTKDQQEVVEREMALLDYTQERYLKLVDTNTALQEQVESYKKLVELTAQAAKPADMSTLRNEIAKSGSYFGKNAQYNLMQADYNTAQSSLASKIKGDKKTISEEQALARAEAAMAKYQKETLEGIERNRKALGGVREIQVALNGLKETEGRTITANTKLTEQQMTKMKTALSAFSTMGNDANFTFPTEVAQKIRELETEVENGNLTWDEFDAKLGEIERQLMALDSSMQSNIPNWINSRVNVQEFGDQCEQAGRKIVQVAEGNQIVQESLHLTEEAIKRGSYAMNDWANRFVSITQVASSTLMGIRALSNTCNLLTEAMSGSEISVDKVTTALTSLFMVVPILTLSTKKLVAMVGITVAAEDAEAISHTGNAFAIGLETIAKKLLRKETVSLNAVLGVTAGTIGATVLAITVAIAVFNYFAQAEERANDAMKSTAESAEEAKNKLESLNSELEQTKARMEELENQPTLTTIEEEELEKLRETNALLERQIAIQEQLNKDALITDAHTIEDNFHRGSRSLREGLDDFKTKREMSYHPWAADELEAYYEERFAELKESISEEYDNFKDTVFEDTYEFLDLQRQYEEAKMYNWQSGFIDVDAWWESLSEAEKVEDFYVQMRDEWLAENEEALAKWRNENNEDWQTKEDEYLRYISAVQEGLIARDEELIAQFQEDIAQMRENFLDEYQILRIYVDPIFENANFEQEFDSIMNKIINGHAFTLSDDLIKELEKAGVSVDDFTNRITDRIRKLKRNMSEFMDADKINAFLRMLNPDDLELLFTLNFENIDSFEEMYQKFLELKAEPSITLTLNIAVEEAREALKTLASGEFIDEEVIESLKEKFASIYDFSNLEDLSMYDQARAIGEALIIASDPQALYNQQLEETKNKLEEINEAIKEQERARNRIKALYAGDIGVTLSDDAAEVREYTERIKELSQEKIELEVDQTEIEEAIKNLEGISDIQIELELDNAMVDAVLGQMGAIEHAASLIGEGFKVEAKNVEELMQTLPQLFEDATIDIQTGMVQLQESIVNQVAETAQAEVNVSAEALREKLTNRYNEIQSEIDLLNQVKLNAYNAQSEEVTSAQIFNNMERENKIKVVQAIIKARMQQAVQERTQSAQSASNAIQDQNKVADAAVEQGQQTADAWRKTAQAAADYMFKFAQNAIENQNAITNGGTAKKAVIAATTTVGRSGSASELSWVYDTSAGSQFATLNKFLENDLQLWEAGTPEAESLAKSISEQLGTLGFNLDANTIQRGTDAIIDAFISNNYATWDDFVTDANTALNDKFYELGIVGTDLSKLLAGIGNSDILKKSGLPDSKSGSKSSKSAKTEKGSELDPKELEERYHEINALIEYQARLLKEVQTQIDRTYGASKLKEFNKEQQKLLDLIDSEQEKMRQAKNWAEYDAATLRSLGLNPQFSDDGRVLNYTQMLQQAVDDYNAFVELWNSHQNEVLTPDASGNYPESWQKQHEQEKEDIEKYYNDRLAALKKFEESVKTYWDEFEKYEQYMRDLEDNKLKKIAYVLEFQVDYKNAKKDVRNLAKMIEEAIGDALDHGLKAAMLNFENMQDELNMKGVYEDNFSQLLRKIDESKFNKYIDQEELANQLENLRDEVIGSAEALIEWAESIEDIVPDAIDAARERFDQFTDQLEHNTTIIDTIKEIMVLQGLTIKTAQGYKDTRDLYTKRMDATLAQAKLNRQWYDNTLKELQIAQAALDGATQGTEQYDILKANRDALLEEFNASQEAMLESAKETMETAREMYIDGVERTAYELEQVLTKGDGFDLLQDKYDHYIDTEERYLDTVNKIYETTKLNNKLQEQIDKTTNAAHAKRLKELQEEFQLREKNNKLSEYDIEIMNAKLQMLMKQMELEDAANNRSTLRLVRNSRGNYDYQFTANPDELNDINQEYLDAAQEWYNIAKNKVKETTGEIIDTWQEMTDRIKEIYEDETLTVDEREARIAEIREYYTQKVKDLEAEKQKAIVDMTEAGNLAIDDFRENHKNVLEEMGGDVDSFRDIFSDDLASILENTDEFNNKFAEDMDDLSEEVARFDELFDDTINKMEEHVGEFNDKIQQVNAEVGTSYMDLKGILDQVSDSTEQITWRGQEAVQNMWEQISAAQQASMEYANMADSILAAARAYQQLAAAINEAQFNRLGMAGDVSYDNQDIFNNKTFDKNTDYSAMMSKYLQDGGSMADLAYQQMALQRDWKIDWLEQKGYTSDYWGTRGTETERRFQELVSGGGNQDWYNYAAGLYSDEEFLRRLRLLGIAGYATGGYTGDFDSGKLAILHEKELVLNAEDTKNILDAVDLVRGENSIWTNIAKTLDASVSFMMTLLSGKFSPSIKVEKDKEVLEQQVDIHAEFPNVTDSREIEEALSNIVNNAAQFASQRN